MFKKVLAKYPRYGLKSWNLCQIAYEGVVVSTRAIVESMVEEEFLIKMVVRLRRQ